MYNVETRVMNIDENPFRMPISNAKIMNIDELNMSSHAL